MKCKDALWFGKRSNRQGVYRLVLWNTDDAK